MFTIQVITSFIVGGLLIALQTLIAERVPLKWRGCVLGFPSTMALGFFFIGLTKTTADVVEAVTFFPAALMPDYVFVAVFAFFVRYRLLTSFIGAYVLWAVFAYGILTFPPANFIVSTFIYALPAILLLYYLIRRLPQVTNLTPVPMTAKHIGIRALLGGCVIVLVVILSKTLGNIWGSLFSAFPAAFSSTFLIYSAVHGKRIIPSVAASLFFPGVLGYILYAWIAGLTFPHIGIWFGTLVSYIAAGIFHWCWVAARAYSMKRI